MMDMVIGTAVNVTDALTSSAATSMPTETASVNSMSGMLGVSSGCKLSVRYFLIQILQQAILFVCIMLS